MRRSRTLLLFLLGLLLLPGTAVARGEIRPASIAQGEVAWLRWSGNAASVVARCRDRVIFLQPSAEGFSALLGADLETPPGGYPVALIATTAGGELIREELTLEVSRADHPVERLELPEAMVSPRAPEILERIGREHEMVQEIYTGTSPAPPGRSFRLPVDNPVSSVFGRRRILNGIPKSPHAGVDFRSPRGTPVLAPGDGRVSFAGDLYFTGQTVILDHGGGLFSVFAHLEAITCRSGEALAAGHPLGRVGSSGRSTGPHLHWGVRLRGDRIDPLVLVELTGGEKI